MLYSICRFKCVISSRNTLIDTPRIMFDQMSGHPGDPVKLTHKIALPPTHTHTTTHKTYPLIMRVLISPQPWQHLLLSFYSHPGKFDVISHCGFDLHSFNDMMLGVFHVLVDRLYIFGEMSIQIICPLKY